VLIRPVDALNKVLDLVRVASVFEVDVGESSGTHATVAPAYLGRLGHVHVFSTNWDEAAKRLKLSFLLLTVFPGCLELIGPLLHVFVVKAGWDG
jgi:hypothetical protein